MKALVSDLVGDSAIMCILVLSTATRPRNRPCGAGNSLMSSWLTVRPSAVARQVDEPMSLNGLKALPWFDFSHESLTSRSRKSKLFRQCLQVVRSQLASTASIADAESVKRCAGVISAFYRCPEKRDSRLHILMEAHQVSQTGPVLLKISTTSARARR